MTRRAGVFAGAFDSELAVEDAGLPTLWRLTRPLIWTGTQGDTFTVPTGFVTDFATIPRFLRGAVEPYGAYTRAAVLHDWLLAELAEWTVKQRGFTTWRDVPDEPPADSRDCDGIFRRVMEDLGVSWSKRWTMWTAVRWASLFNWRRAYGRQIGKDLPAMLVMSIPAALIVAPSAIGTLITLGMASFINLILRGRPAAR